MKCATHDCRNNEHQIPGHIFLKIEDDETRKIWICNPCWTRLNFHGFKNATDEPIEFKAVLRDNDFGPRLELFDKYSNRQLHGADITLERYIDNRPPKVSLSVNIDTIEHIQ